MSRYPNRLVLVSLAVGFAAARPATARAQAVSVKLDNPLDAPRAAETIAVGLKAIRDLAPALDPRKLVVVDEAKRPVPSQLVDLDGDEAPDELVFQTDLAARGSKTFSVQGGDRALPARDAYRVYGRFVRERHDDFAWENDRIAHRMYGPGLETAAHDPLTSSGIDVWVKRVPRLLVNEWYLTDDYHRDHGDGADMYAVGKSRGCGGLGIWMGDKLAVSRNFASSRVLANGPIRLVFELAYPPWKAGEIMLSETKRITLDAGSNFDRVETFIHAEARTPRPLAVAVGIAKHEGGAVLLDKKGGWMRSWEPLKPEGGNLGCAIVLGPGTTGVHHETDSDHLIVFESPPGKSPLRYDIGVGWDRSPDGAAPDAAGWTKTVERHARDLAAPVRVTLNAAPAGAAAQTSKPK
jgi:pectinesterase